MKRPPGVASTAVALADGRLRLQQRRHPGWNQYWRAPLREARWTGCATSWPPLFEAKAQTCSARPLERAQRIHQRHSGPLAGEPGTVLSRTQARHDLNEQEKITVLKLMELQRHAMLMYTSCGWFFDEISGIETVQVVQYAARAMQLAQELFGQDLQPGLPRTFRGRQEQHSRALRWPVDLREICQTGYG